MVTTTLLTRLSLLANRKGLGIIEWNSLCATYQLESIFMIFKKIDGF